MASTLAATGQVCPADRGVRRDRGGRATRPRALVLSGQARLLVESSHLMPTAFQEIAELYGLMDKFNQLANEYTDAPPARQAEIRAELREITRKIELIKLRYQN